MKKYVYFFGRGKAEGSAAQRNLLGGKGAGLAEMTRIGLPVPAGFTITTEACAYYFAHQRRFPRELKPQVQKALARLEQVAGRRFGDPKNPLLVSVRSGAAVSMPGMMETILNLGLNDRTVEGLAAASGDARFAWDAYRRFIQMYASVVEGIPRELFEERIRELKKRLNVLEDPQIPADGWRQLVGEFQDIYRRHCRREFPQDPQTQLWGAIRAVFESWMGEKAVTYRRVEKITGLLGTAVNVVQMVFGNLGENSGTGVCFTRDPSTGEPRLYGDFLPNAQGEDVVAGVRTPLPLAALKERMPSVYRQLERARRILERHYRDMQDVEFTVEQGRLYILQTRSGKRTAVAAFRIAVDMARERLITKAEAVERIQPADIERLFYPTIDPNLPREVLERARLATGVNAVPGAASGRIVFTAEEAEQWARRGESVILVRRETSPEDVGGMYAAQGILTATGGKTSHAAVVARGWGKCCIVGCSALDIDYATQTMRVDGRELRQGDWITLDGEQGIVYEGQLPLVTPQLPDSYFILLTWADQLRRLGVRTNADTPQDARKAREMGAEGIGLCRTEHMFFKDFECPEKSIERQLAIQEMILADTPEERRRALDKLLPFQRRDFIGIFEAMNGYPVTIRLLDPPLHEFVPHDAERQRELAEKMGMDPEVIAHRVEQLREANPMLGHRGCRLTITYPEILDMQVRAIIEAAIECKRKGIKVLPEIMHPLVMDRKELQILADRTEKVADAVMKEKGERVDFLIGTMIELPRAALLADKIAEVASFFSFGTNDLTQTVMGLSRDDAGRFLPDYLDETKAGIFRSDPFQTLDLEGVGLLIEWAIQRGRRTRPRLKVGICGEHGGDPATIHFCHRVGMDYVSASPLRVPIARLAAAHAAIKQGRRTRTERPIAQ